MDGETERKLSAIILAEARKLKAQADEVGVGAFLRPHVRYRPNSQFLRATVNSVEYGMCLPLMVSQMSFSGKHHVFVEEMWFSCVLTVSFLPARCISGNKVAEMREMWQQRQKELVQGNSRTFHTGDIRCKNTDMKSHASEDLRIEETSRLWEERDTPRRKRSPQGSRHEESSDHRTWARIGHREATETVREHRKEWELTGNSQAQQRDMCQNHGMQRQTDDAEADDDRWQMDEGAWLGASGVVEGGRLDSPYPQTVVPRQDGDVITHISDQQEEKDNWRAGVRSKSQQPDDGETLMSRHKRSRGLDHGLTDEELAAFLRSRLDHPFFCVKLHFPAFLSTYWCCYALILRA